MNLLLIPLGLLALGVPHVVAAGFYDCVPTSGLAYAGEIAFSLILLTWITRRGIDTRRASHWMVASLTCSVATVLFGAVCSFAASDALGAGAVLLEQLLHAAAVSTWLIALLAGRDKAASDPVPWAAYALAGIGGALWYLVQAAVMKACGTRVQYLDVILVANTLLCALPCAVSLVLGKLNQKQCVALVALPLVGALVGNRAWALLELVGLPSYSLRSLGAAMLVAPVLMCGVLVILWMAGLMDVGTEPSVLPDEAAKDTTPAAPPSVSLPLNNIPGYQQLSERERQVLLYALDGATAQETADQTGIAAATVRTYRARALAKLGVADVAELLTAVRLSIQDPVTLLSEPEEDASPATRTLIERLTPLSGVGCLTACVLLLAVCLRLPPSEAIQELAGCGVFAACAVLGYALSERSQSDPDESGTIVLQEVIALLIGCAVALVVVALAKGPQAWLLRRIIIGAPVLAVAFWVGFRVCALQRHMVWHALGYCGVAGMAFIPASRLALEFLQSVWPLALAAICAITTLPLLRQVINDELAYVASAALSGDERTLAYLKGRGLTDLQSQVVLLTAQNYPMGGIASTLHVSTSTVAQYRSKAYKALDVDGKLELMELLYREAGLEPKIGRDIDA